MIGHAIHGLSAHSRARSENAIRARAEWIQRDCREHEICVADMLIGPVGVVVTGDITCVWHEDCWSVKDDDGRRWATDCGRDADLVDPTDDEWRQRVADWRWLCRATGRPAKYLEAWMSHATILRVVHVGGRWASAAEAAASALRVPCEQVPGTYGIDVPDPGPRLLTQCIRDAESKLRELERERIYGYGRSYSFPDWVDESYRLQRLRDMRAHERSVMEGIRELRSLRARLIRDFSREDMCA